MGAPQIGLPEEEGFELGPGAEGVVGRNQGRARRAQDLWVGAVRVPQLDRAEAATPAVLGAVCGAQVGSPALVISHSCSPEAQQKDPRVSA